MFFLCLPKTIVEKIWNVGSVPKLRRTWIAGNLHQRPRIRDG
jgi:hypothetical protein